MPDPAPRRGLARDRARGRVRRRLPRPRPQPGERAGSTTAPAADASATASSRRPSPATSSTATSRTGRWTTRASPPTSRTRRSSTLALFSVTHTSKGALNTKQRGYGLITGDIGRRLIREAHERGARVELVYTSFGGPRNRRLLESEELQAQVIASLVALAADLGVDGINVDIEALDPTLVPAYGGFVGGPPGGGPRRGSGRHGVGRDGRPRARRGDGGRRRGGRRRPDLPDGLRLPHGPLASRARRAAGPQRRRGPVAALVARPVRGAGRAAGPAAAGPAAVRGRRGRWRAR